MMPGRSQIWVMTLTALVSVILSAAVQAQDTTERKPTFKLQALDGRVTDLANEKGSVVLISFGATWCAPCRTELRVLNEIQAEYRDKPVKFFWVSVEAPEQISNAALKRYAKQWNLSFPILRDSSQAVFSQFSPRVRLPMIVVLNKDGDVDAPVQFGMRSPADAYKTDIRARLDKLLAPLSPVGRGPEGENAKRTRPKSLTPTLSQRDRG